MKKIFFFLIIFFPVLVHAGTIESFTVRNGELSRKFESNNNVYSVNIFEGETRFLFDYTLENEEDEVVITGDEYDPSKENKTEITVTDKFGTKEVYTFYLEREETTPVFQTVNLDNSLDVKRVIPHLEIYVGISCLIIILILFKIIVLGFKKKR